MSKRVFAEGIDQATLELMDTRRFDTAPWNCSIGFALNPAFSLDRSRLWESAAK